MAYHVEIDPANGEYDDLLRDVAVRTLAAEGVQGAAELSILLSDDTRVRELNRAYRHIDATTDVLSFAQAEGEIFAQPEGARTHLGDVVISLDTARRQARDHDIALSDELAHLLVHGVLHLLGYDHERQSDAAVMRAQEDAVLGEAHHH